MYLLIRPTLLACIPPLRYWLDATARICSISSSVIASGISKRRGRIDRVMSFMTLKNFKDLMVGAGFCEGKNFVKGTQS